MNENLYDANQFVNPAPWLADDAADEEAWLPEHLVGLPGDRWAIWRQVVLRGAGFPATLVLELAAPECAAAADRLLQAEAAAEQARDALVDALMAALDAPSHDPEQHEQHREIRSLRRRMLRRLRQMKLLDESDDAIADAASAQAFRTAIARLDAARADFERAFDAGAAEVSEAIMRLAANDRFREAITWQNRSAFQRAVASLRGKASGSARIYKKRLNEELIANYLQRYCVKNDTIGFFGPVGWAHIEPQDATTSVQPGPRLLAARTVYFDEWGINALARRLAENDAMLPWIAPRRLPFFHVEQTTLCLPAGATLPLTAQQAAILHACDGARLAREIALECIRTPTNGLASEAEVYAVLGDLRDQGLITWTLEVPMELRPERMLQRLLERVGDQPLRTAALAALNQLDSARAAVARAAGDAAQLDAALDELEATFTQLTDTPATRSAGQIYASRTLVYEDCRRDIEVTIGSDVLQTLGTPLALILTSARWFTHEMAAIYRAAFKGIYDDCVRAAGSRVVPLIDFWQQAQTLMPGGSVQLVDGLAATFQERWMEILGLPASQQRVAYTSSELQQRVQAAFGMAAPGWRSTLYHSPDVLIAAPDIAAIQRGDYQFVMGELHIGLNTMGGPCFLSQHPFQEDLFLALERDLPEGRIIPVIPRSWPRMTSRTRLVLVSPRDYRLVFAPDASGVAKSRALEIGSLVLEETDSGVVVRTRDGRLSFDLIETFALMLSIIASQEFRILPPSGHTPRVTIDRLVVCREAWHYAVEELSFAEIEHDHERFLATRRWARTSMMPRMVFVKVPVEDKPFYVDFDSPIYVNILSRMIRRTKEDRPPNARITISEMLPELEQLWLPDAEGQHYTSELRFAVLDQASQE
jgi:hypothetical protein